MEFTMAVAAGKMRPLPEPFLPIEMGPWKVQWAEKEKSILKYS
jgi:hypothetical protein